MRLSDVLSNRPDTKFVQVEGFINSSIPIGKQREIKIGRIYSTYYCEKCGGMRQFRSSDKLFCVGVGPQRISIDCVMECIEDKCTSTVAVWFLIESYSDMVGLTSEVRILKRREKLSEGVKISVEPYSDYAELLDKADRAYRDGLGAGAMVYLRKIYEKITLQTADAYSIPYEQRANGYIPFVPVLKTVDDTHKIIPQVFSGDKERLFSELSAIVHGEYDEDLAIQKYEPLRTLVVGILNNVKSNQEYTAARDSLNWNSGGTSQ